MKKTPNSHKNKYEIPVIDQDPEDSTMFSNNRRP